jgi:hypothetical protein
MRIIKEELNLFLEQAATGEAGLALSDEAKRTAAETAAKVKASNATTLASLEQYKSENPNLDHAAVNAAIENLQKVGTEVDASMKSITAENKNINELWPTVARAAGSAAGGWAASKAASYLDEDDYEVFTQEVLESDEDDEDEDEIIKEILRYLEANG